MRLWVQCVELSHFEIQYFLKPLDTLPNNIAQLAGNIYGMMPTPVQIVSVFAFLKTLRQPIQLLYGDCLSLKVCSSWDKLFLFLYLHIIDCHLVKLSLNSSFTWKIQAKMCHRFSKILNFNTDRKRCALSSSC